MLFFNLAPNPKNTKIYWIVKLVLSMLVYDKVKNIGVIWLIIFKVNRIGYNVNNIIR